MQLALSSGVLFLSLVLQQQHAPFRTQGEALSYREMTVPRPDIVLPTTARDRDAYARRRRRAALRKGRDGLPTPLLHRIVIRDRNGLQTAGLLLSCGVLSLALFFDALARAERRGQGLSVIPQLADLGSVAFLYSSSLFMLSQIIVPMMQAVSPLVAARFNRGLEKAISPMWPTALLGPLRVTEQERILREQAIARSAAQRPSLPIMERQRSVKDQLAVLGVEEVPQSRRLAAERAASPASF